MACRTGGRPMRSLAIVLAVAISAPAASAGPVPAPAVKLPHSPTADNCPRTARHYAEKGSLYRGDGVAPKRLTELPPAIGYMAVYRTVNGCEVPLTMTDYRTGRRP